MQHSLSIKVLCGLLGGYRRMESWKPKPKAMRQLTISDLGVLVNSKTLASSTNYDQKNLQLVIKQIFLGLPVKPLLDAHPQINQWVDQVRSALRRSASLSQVPEIFTEERQLCCYAEGKRSKDVPDATGSSALNFSYEK